MGVMTLSGRAVLWCRAGHPTPQLPKPLLDITDTAIENGRSLL